MVEYGKSIRPYDGEKKTESEELNRYIEKLENHIQWLEHENHKFQREHKIMEFCAIVVIIALIIGGTVIYKKISSLSSENGGLQAQISSLTEENTRYFGEKNNLQNQVNSLRTEVITLNEDVGWLNEYIKIVVADEGSLYKTYHTYDCEKWRDYSFWAYNKEQVINNSEYEKCPDCN